MAGVKVLSRDGEAAFYREFGRIITAERKKLGLTQKDIARELGVTFQQIQKYESGDNRIPLFLLHKMSVRYGVSFARAIGNDLPDFEYRVLDTVKIKTMLVELRDRMRALERYLESE